MMPKPHREFFDDSNILGFDSAYQKYTLIQMNMLC